MNGKSRIWLNSESSEIMQSQEKIFNGASTFHASVPGYKQSQLINLSQVSTELGISELLLKDESNRFGLPSFKILGASYGCCRAISAKLGLSDKITIPDLHKAVKNHEITLYAATDGNHGRAVSHTASLLGIKAVILVPEELDQYTQDAISSSGGKVMPIASSYDGVVKEAERLAQSDQHGILIQDTSWPGYEKIPAWIVEGYSTIFEELGEQIGSLSQKDVVIVPVGVGSLAHATVLSLKTKPNPPVIVAIEPGNAACLNTSLHAGDNLSIQTEFTIMTGMNCGTVSYTAWNDLRTGIDISLVITEQQAHEAVECLKQMGVDAGPCGAATIAAVRVLSSQGILNKNSRVIVINTEGYRPYTIREAL